MTSTPLLDELEQSAAATAHTERFVGMRLEDGSYFQLRKLPWAAIAELEQSTGVSWLVIIDAPEIHGRVLAELARLVAIAADEPMPPLDTVEDVIRVSDRLAVVDGEGRRLPDQPPKADPDRIAWTAPAGS